MVTSVLLICIGERCRGSVVMNPTVRVHADLAGYPLHRENRENGQRKFHVREKAENLELLPKHREFGLLKL